jgi:hypothetical protein
MASKKLRLFSTPEPGRMKGKDNNNSRKMVVQKILRQAVGSITSPSLHIFFHILSLPYFFINL